MFPGKKNLIWVPKKQLVFKPGTSEEYQKGSSHFSPKQHKEFLRFPYQIGMEKKAISI